MKHIFFSLTLLTAFGLFPHHAISASYAIDHSQSHASFSGTHASNAFKGDFKTWSAVIDFDPAQLSTSTISAEFDLESAKTGNAMYDGTLPQKDWFNIKEHPKAVFKSTAITHKDGSVYTVNGDLTLRGITQQVTFDFTLDEANAPQAVAKANFDIDRLAFDIGKKSDEKAEWVSKNIAITLDIAAKRQ